MESKVSPTFDDEIKKQIIVLLVSLILSILVGYIPDWTGQIFSTAEQTLLSVTLFIAFLLLDVLWVTSVSSTWQRKEHESWVVRNDGELILSNIRSNYFHLVQDAMSPKDLFVLYFLEEFEQLSHRIKDASESQSLTVSSNHLFVAQGIFDPTTYGGDKIVIRYLWILDEGERLFEDYPWRRYFEQITIRARRGTIKAIRTIFVIDRIEVCEIPRIKLFLDFFKTNKGFDCRLINKTDLNRLSVQNSIASNYIDFGIYGNHLLFRTEQYGTETVGEFAKDASLIKTYTTFFEIMWNSKGLTKENPSKTTKKVSLEELFLFDLEQPV